MAHLLAAVFALSALVSFVSAAPVPKHLMPRDPPLTFPTTVGTKWVYELPGGREQTIVISAVKEEKDGSRVVTMEYLEDGKRTPYQVRRVSTRGIFVLVDGTQKYEEPLCIVRLPHREGQTWAASLRSAGNTDGPKGQRVAGPFEQVRVPAGNFSAACIKWELNGGQTGTNWYVNGIGLVKGTNYMELKSFTPGKE
jgi:hypothetical protein